MTAEEHHSDFVGGHRPPLQQAPMARPAVDETPERELVGPRWVQCTAFDQETFFVLSESTPLCPFNLMITLSEKISKLRRRPRPVRVKKIRTPEQRHEDRVRFWILLSIGVVVSLGVYFWLTSARILGKPIEFAYGPSDPAFAETSGPLLGAEYADGNSVETLVNGDAFFPAMLKAIAGQGSSGRVARHSPHIRQHHAAARGGRHS